MYQCSGERRILRESVYTFQDDVVWSVISVYTVVAYTFFNLDFLQSAAHKDNVNILGAAESIGGDFNLSDMFRGLEESSTSAMSALFLPGVS